MSSSPSSSPPRAPPIKYSAPLGTRWDKEKAAAGGPHAFDFPSDPKFIGPWIVGECVGKGASGRVKIAKHRITGQLAAVKILPLAPLVTSRAELVDPAQLAKSEKQRLGIDREITMMKLMNHPNILRIYDVYEGAKELFLVLEYVEGGELFDFLVNKGRLPPADAQAFFKQIIYGLNYAHTFSIIHRDLKPENILIASLNPPLIKIADWGMAAFAPPSLQLETSCGSPHYASPEIVNGDKYQGNATDIWSCGVILFALLTGRLPFDDKNVKVLLTKVKSGKYDMPAYIDPQAKDLLSRMLVVDSSMRITIPEILRHPWLLKPISKHSSQSQSVNASTTLSLPPTPPLPPSPSTLGRPIPSASLIDPDLFASLRVIWGRHADVRGDIIKRDLLAPAGEGVHAKAFYFLLRKFKEETEKASLGGGLGESLTFNLGWELDYGQVDANMVRVSSHEGSAFGRYKGNSTVMRKAYSEQPRHSHSHATTQLPMVSGLAPPAMTRMSSTTASSRGASDSTVVPSRPLGPRVPSTAPARKSSFGVSPMPPMPRRGYTYSGPSILREDKDRGDRNHLEAKTNIVEGVSSVHFPRHPIQRAKTYRPRSRSGEDTEDTYTRLAMTRDRERRGERRVVSGKTETVSGATSNVDNSSTTAASHPEPGIVTERKILSPTPVRASTLPSPNPRSASSRAKDDNPPRLPHPVPELTNVKDSTRSRTVSLVANGRPGKENGGSNATQDAAGGRPVLGDANTNTENGVTVAGKGKKGKLRPPPLEFPFPPLNRKRSTIADTSGNALGSSTPPAALPPSPQPLAHNINHLPKSYGLTSPKSYSTSKNPLISPKFPHFPQLPQTEFKGWLSNLFGGWRSPSSSGHWSDGVLYSVHDVKRTTSDVVCLLEGIGINVVIETISGGGPDEELVVLKSGYRMDDTTASTTSPTSFMSTAATPNLGESTNVGTATNNGDLLGHLNMKPLRFRVEIFTSLPSSQPPRDLASPTMLSPPMSPLFSPTASPRFSCDGTSYFPPTQGPRTRSTTSPLPSTKVMAAPACDGVTTILLRLDKGSGATFKAIGKKLRDVYSDTPPSPGWVVVPGDHGDAEPIGVAV